MPKVSSFVPRLLASLALVTALGSAAWAQQPPMIRIRGTIEAVDGPVLSIKSRDGTDVKVRMTDSVAIAGISHESNSFNPTRATLADFEGEDALSGNRQAWLETTAKSNTNASGMIAGAAQSGMELYPIHFYQATPRGPIDDQGFNTMVSRIIDGLKKGPAYDGVLLTLHGAMVVDSYPSGDAEIVRPVWGDAGCR